MFIHCFDVATSRFLSSNGFEQLNEGASAPYIHLNPNYLDSSLLDDVKHLIVITNELVYEEVR